MRSPLQAAPVNEPTDTDSVIPLVEERIAIDKRAVETGKVRIRTVVEEKLERVSQDLERDDVTIERVPVNREVTEAPRVREENGVLIVPVLEEVVFIEKRLVLKEELHVHRNLKQERVEGAVRVKQMRADVERVRASPANPDPAPAESGLRRRGSRLHRKEPLR